MEEKICLKLNLSQLRFITKNPVLPRLGNAKSETLSEVHTNIKCILMSHKGRLTVSELIKEYWTLCFSPLPYKDFGYKTARDLLSSFTDLLSLEEEGDDYIIIVKDFIKESHVYKLVAAQRTPRPKADIFPDEMKYKNAVPMIPFPVQDIIRELLWKNRRGIGLSVFYDWLKRMAPLEYWEIDVGPRKIVDSVPHLLKIVDDKVLPMYPIESSEVFQLHSFHKNQFIAPLLRVSKSEKDIGKKLEKLIEEEQEIFLEEIPYMYHKKFKRDLKYHQLGFKSLREFLTVVPGKFKMECLNESFILTPKKKSICEGDHGYDMRCQCPESFNLIDSQNILIRDVRNLIFSRPEGLKVDHIPLVFEAIYLRKMVIRGNLGNFFKELHDQKAVRLTKEEGTCIVKPGHEYTEEEIVSLQPVIKCTDNIASISDKYLEIPELPLNKPIIFEVTHMESASCFYVQTHECEVEDPFFVPQDIIDSTMAEFYDRKCYEYAIEEISFQCEGLPVAFSWKGLWHRGIVVEGASALSNFAKVFDVDRGETVLLSGVDVCYLLKPFISPTPRAMKATGAEEKKEKWADLLIFGTDCLKCCVVAIKDGLIHLQ